MEKEITEGELFELERKVLSLSFQDSGLSHDIKEIEQEMTKLFGSTDIVKKEINSLKEIVSKKEYSEFNIVKLKFSSAIKSLYLQYNMRVFRGILKTVKKVEFKNKVSKDIFIVHGHNEEMKKKSSDFISKLGLKPIILHQQPNRNRTIIKKFSDYTNIVNFAIILLSADDFGYKKKR